MATSLSNETSMASFLEYSSDSAFHQTSASHVLSKDSSKSAFSGSRQDSQAHSQPDKKSSSQANSSNQNNNYTASGSNQSSSASMTQSRGDSLTASQRFQQQQASLIQNAGYAYPLFSNHIFGFPPTQAQSNYNYQSQGLGSGNMPSSQTTQSTQSTRRGGKKKAPTTQQISPESRLFFTLRRRDAQAAPNKGPAHMYKPKNPPTIFEWFKKLTVEERMNALSTVYPRLTDTFINMQQTIDINGQSSFAWQEPSQQSYMMQGYPYYSHSYQSNSSSSGSDYQQSYFDQYFYSRVQHETEIQRIKSNEKEKTNAEQEIIRHLRLTDYFDYLDTLTVTEDLVVDSDYFFKVMSQASNNQTFMNPCQYVFDQKSTYNSIDQPSWFKPKSFNSMATWVVVALEENLWAHYNFENNLNLGTAKINELNSLFKEKTDRGALDVEITDLSKYWKQMPDNEKKQLISQLQTTCQKDIEKYENSNIYLGGSKSQNKQVQSKSMSYSVQIKERTYSAIDRAASLIQTEQELKVFISLSQIQGSEHDFMKELAYTSLGRTHYRQVLISRTFLDLIKNKYKDDLMENLLMEEQQTTKTNKQDLIIVKTKLRQSASTVQGTQNAGGQTKKKKKKSKQEKIAESNNNSNNQQQSQLNSNSTDKIITNLTTDSIVEMLVDDEKQHTSNHQKQSISDKNAKSQNSVQSHHQNSVSQNNQKKKKKSSLKPNNAHAIPSHQDLQRSNSINLEAQQFNDSQQVKSKAIDEVPDLNKKSGSIISQSNICDKTTAHQSSDSYSNLSKTQQSRPPEILNIQSSKSLDLNPVSKSKAFNNENNKQINKQALSKVETKNYQILQNSQNQESINKGTRFNKQFKSKDQQQSVTQSNIASNNMYSDNTLFSDDEKLKNQVTGVDLTINQASAETQGELDSSESDNNLEVIKQYVLKLTTEIVNEVCRRSESANSNHSPSTNNNYYNKQINHHQDLRKKKLPEYFNMGATNHHGHHNGHQAQEYYNGGQRKQSFYQKHMHENNSEQQYHTEYRKTSFNGSKKSFKDDKKFSEDYSDNYSTNYQENFNSYQPKNSGLSSYNEGENGSSRKQSINEVQRHSANHRKGFGIHKTNQIKQDDQNSQKLSISEQDTQEAWAKGVVKQSDTKSKNKSKNQAKKKQENNNLKEQTVQPKSQKTQNNNIKPDINKNNDNESVKSQNLESKESGQEKKRRNRKKAKKVDPTDIMNNFMKNLQSNVEEHKVEHKLNYNNGNRSQFQKRGSVASVTQNQRSQNQNSQTSKQPKIQEAPNDNLLPEAELDFQGNEQLGQNKKQYRQKNFRQNQTYQQPINEKKSVEQDIKIDSISQSELQDLDQSDVSSVKNQNGLVKGFKNYNKSIESKESQHNNQERPHKNSFNQNQNNIKNSFKKPYYNKHNNHNQRQHKPQPHFEDFSVRSTVAERSSEKSSRSQNMESINDQINNQDPQIQAFKKLQFKQTTNEWENNSITDFTGTTNTAADTSLEINVNNNSNEEKKEAMLIQDQSQTQIQVSLTDSIDAKNLLKTNNLAQKLQMFQQKVIQSSIQQSLHEMNDIHMIPPNIQSPNSTLSTSHQIFTPQGHHGQYLNYNQNLSINNFNLEDQFGFQRNQGYQSYQNTPSKSQSQNYQPLYNQNNPFKPSVVPQNQPSLSEKPHKDSQNQNYRTPPQLTKKNQSAQNNYSNHGTFRKPHAQQNGQNQALNPVFQNFDPKKPLNQTRSHQQQNQYQPNYPQIQGHHSHPQKPLNPNFGFVPNLMKNQSAQDPLCHQQQFMQFQMQDMINMTNFYQQQQDPNLYYNSMMNQFDTFKPQQKPQEEDSNIMLQVFNYSEKQNAINSLIQQPTPVYPQPMINQPFNFDFGQQQDFMANQYQYQRPMPQQNYYDQGQDLIMQIVNSIKSNQQPLSPIPQYMATSPPPMMDLNMSNSQVPLMNGAPNTVDSYQQNTQEQVFYDKFDNEISSFINQISDNLLYLKPERDYVQSKIEKIAQQIFVGQQPKIELFGSLITGLALESSDMDLAVTGLFIEDRYAVICELNKLGQAIQGWQCLESFKCIETASIPVIKLKVDLIKLREQEMMNGQLQDKEINEEQRYLSVDITFDDSSANQQNLNGLPQGYLPQELFGTTGVVKTHLGLQSCALVQHYIANYQNLKEVSILLKRFLAIHKFNSPYYAYMNYYNLKGNHQLSPSRLLMGFLDFYGNYFNASCWGISVHDEGSFYQLNSHLDSNFVILDPLNLQNNTTRNSYLTQDILKKFQCSFNNLKSLIFKNPQLSNAVQPSSVETALDQNSSIPFERRSPQQQQLEQNQPNSYQDNKQLKTSITDVDKAPANHSEQLEEHEANNPLNNAESQVDEKHQFSQVCLLEIFFAKETQPVIANLSSVSQARSDELSSQKSGAQLNNNQ